MKKAVVLLFATASVCFNASANLLITGATGGTGISADTAANAPSPAWTSLGSITIKENNGHQGDFAASGSVVLTAPSGFEFNTNAGSASFTNGKNITAATVTVAPSTVTVSVTVSGTTQTDTLNINGLQVRPTQASPVASGNIAKGTSSNLVFGNNPTFGALSEVAGAPTALAITTQPSTNATAVTPFAQQPVVRVVDQFGNTSLTNNSGIVSASVASGTGTLVGTTDVTFVNGVGTYTNLGANAAGPITILFSSGSLTSVTSDAVDVTGPPTASALVIQTQPSTTATAGVAFATQPAILIRDQFGADLTNDNSTVVTAARFDGAGTLQGTLTATAVNGVATFTDLSHTVATNITIRFTSGFLSSATSGNIAVSATTADHIAFSVEPGNAVAGIAFGTQPVVVTLDQYNNPSSVGLAGALDLSVALTTGTGPLNGTTNINIGTSGASGVAAFSNLSITAADLTNQLTASAAGFSNVTSAIFSVVPQVAAQLVITTQPSTNAVAGAAFVQQPVVEVRDSVGNLMTSDSSTVVHVARGAGTGALAGTVDVTVVNGVATFTDLAFNSAQTITLVFSSGVLTNATSDSIVVSAAPASRLAFTTQPAGGYAGSAFLTQPVLVTRDQFGNNSVVGLASNQVVTVALTTGSGTVIGTTTVDIGTAAGNGTAIYTDLGVSAAGQGKVITASSTGFTNAVSAAFNIGGVEPAVANISADTSLTGFTVVPNFTYFEAQSGDVGVGEVSLSAPVGYEFVAGGTPQVVIQKLTGGGNTGNINGGGNHQVLPLTVTTTNISFTVSSSTSGGKTASIVWQNVRMRALTSSTAVSGTITKAAGATLTSVVDGTTSFAAVQTVGGAVATLVIQTQPSTNAAVGVAFAQQPVIALQDQFGNACNADNTTVVTAVRNLGMADLQGTTNITAINGIVTFTNLSYNVAEAITINFSTGALTPVTSDTIQVGAGSVHHLAFFTQPGSALVGIPFGTQPVIKTVDAYGNPTTGGLNAYQDVALSLAAGDGPLAGTVLLNIGTSFNNGTVTFTNLQINSIDDSNVLFAVAVESGIGSAYSAAFPVTAAPAQLIITQGDGQTTSAGATLAINPAVQVLDVSNAPIAGLTVSFVVQLGGGNVGSATAVTDTNGVASTSWTLGSTAGANTLVASTYGLGSNVTFTATATSAPAAQLVITTQPSSNAVAGVAFTQQPVVQIQDAFGNVVATDTNTVVHVARGTGTAAVQGTVDVTAVNGVVTFSDLSYNRAETLTLVFSSGALTNATSDNVVVSAAAADRLAFTTQPAGGYSGSPLTTQPVVQSQDAFGNASTVGLGATQVVTLTLTNSTGTLAGTTTSDIGTNSGNGVTAFTDIQLNGAGPGKQLIASSIGLSNALSAAFTIGGVEPASANISADTAVSGFTTITGPTYYEAAAGDVGVGTIVLTAPAGYEFDAGGTAPTVRVQKTSGPGNQNNIQATGSPAGGANNAVWPVTSVSTTEIVFTVTSSSIGKTDSLKWQNIRIRALVGSPLGNGIITDSGTATLAAVTNGVTSFANVQTVAGALNHLTISVQPSTNAIVGAAFAQQPVVRLEDQFNNVLAADSTTQVTATRNLGTSALAGTTVVTATNGVATFTDLSYNVAELITIDFSSGALPIVTSGTIAVGAGVANHLVFAVEPNGAVVGYPLGIQPVVRSVDVFGNYTSGNLASNLTLSVSLVAGSGLVGTTSADIGTAAGNGTATFTDLQINNASLVNQLAASAAGLGSVTSAVFAVTTADHLEYVSGDNQTGIVGLTLANNLSVRALDISNAPVAGVYVTFAVTSGGGSVGNLSALTDSNGIASTSFTLGGTAGTTNNSVTASASVPGNPKSYTFFASADPGIAAQLGVQTQPSTNAVAGVAFATQPVIRIEDLSGNLIVSDSSTIVTVSRGTGTGAGATGLQGTLAVTAVNGIVTFTNLSYNKAETINLIFTPNVALTATNSVDIVVDPATATKLAFTTQPGSARTDSVLSVQPVVKSQDQFGNASTVGLSSSLTLSVALTTGTGKLLGTTNIDIGTGAGNGVATFTNLQISAAGLNKQLTASAGSLTNAVSATFIIGGVDPAVIPTVPANGSSVSAVGPTYYELASGDIGTGTITLNVPVGYQFDTNSTPTVTVKRIGGNGGPVNNINGANNGGNGSTFAVTSFSATQITFTVTNPSTNGVTDSLAFNNISIKAATGIPAAQSYLTKTGTSIMQAVVNGVTSFGEIIGDPRPVQIVIQTQPSSSANAGIAFAQQPVVLVEDQFGNLWTNSSVNVTAAIASGTGALQGTVTVGSVNGVVTFSGLSYNVAETITISFNGSLLVGTTSGNVVVGAGTANHLVFSTQPGNAVYGSALAPQPVVKTQDQFGNNSTLGLGTNVSVTLAVSSGTGSVVGTSTLNIGTSGGNGTATFAGLQVNAAGSKQLTASAGGFTDAVSATFVISKADQSISFGSLADKVVGDAPFNVNATASSGLSVSFSVQGPATIAGNTITLDGNTGTVVVTASQLGDSNFNAATNVNQSFTVSAVATPAITTQPVSLTVNQGSNATFSVVATGPSLVYQWLFNGTNLLGATTDSLTITNAQGSNEGVYAVVVTNASGSVTSSNATLTVIVPPAITAQPTTATAGLGDNFSLSVSAGAGFTVTGTQPFSYQWQKAGNNLNTQTTSALTLLNVNNGDAGDYTVVLSNAAGSVTSAPIALTVVSVVAPQITSQPVGQSVIVGGTATFTVGATGTLLNYQWRLNGTNLVGAISSSLVINPVHRSDAGVYSVVVSNSAAMVISSNATLTVTTITNDIDFDGHADLLLESTNNLLALWNLAGTNFFSSLLLNDGAALAAGSRVVGQADFNKDGNPDLVIQNGGLISLLIMDETNITQTIAINTTPISKAWKVVGAHDFNKDGSVDILFLNDAGYLAVWLMNGTTKTKSVLLRGGIAIPPSWKVVGCDDFNHDGSVDLLWQNNNGNLVVWYMNGLRYVSLTRLGVGLLPSQGWRIVGLVDLNADGVRDVLWQNADGRLFTWFMDGVNVTGSNFLLDGQSLPAGWSVVGEK